MRSRMSVRGWWVVLLVATASLTWGCCDWCPEKPEPPPAFKLYLDHECVGAWTPINNTFATSDHDKIWNGVLVQLGKFDDIQEGFKSVTFKLKGTTVATLTKGQFRWLNIAPKGASPMTTSHVDVLMPPSGTPCADVEKCARDPNNLCVADANDALNKCFRQERLHMDLMVDAIITLWAKPGEYTVKAKAVGGDASHPPILMTYEFQLGQDMEIKAYDAAGAPVSGFPSLPSGTVDEIVVSPEDGSNHGGAHSPPWPES